MTATAPAEGMWPDPSRPGVPENPEVEGLHLIRFPWAKHDMAARWHRGDFASEGDPDWLWRIGGEYYRPASMARDECAYLGPVRTDAEVRAAAEEMRSVARDTLRSLAQEPHVQAAGQNLIDLHNALAGIIDALPLPASSALEARVQAAVEKEREACLDALDDLMGWVDHTGKQHDADHEGWNSALAKAAAAIRARKGA